MSSSYPYRILNHFANRLFHVVKFWGNCAPYCKKILDMNLIANSLASGIVVEQGPLIHNVTLKPSDMVVI